jgi:hypothetical protein
LQPNPNIPSNIRPVGDLGAHFLPFDIANFAFSRDLNLTQAAQDAARETQEKGIFKLNMNVYNIEKPQLGAPRSSYGSDSIEQLIRGWYTDVTPTNVTPKFNYDYFSGTFTEPDPNAYVNAYAHSCRTCHVAMDRDAFEISVGGLVVSPPYDQYVCGHLVPSATVKVDHLMPNSKVTSDRFWLSPRIDVIGQPSETVVPGQFARLNPDQVYYLAFILPSLRDSYNVPPTICPPPPR